MLLCRVGLNFGPEILDGLSSHQLCHFGGRGRLPWKGDIDFRFLGCEQRFNEGIEFWNIKTRIESAAFHHHLGHLPVDFRAHTLFSWCLLAVSGTVNPLSFAQLLEDFVVLWETACFELGENEVSICDHIEHAVLPFDELCFDPEAV